MGRIAYFIRRHYAPFILKPFVKGVVLLAFMGIFFASVISMQHIQLGLGASIYTIITTTLISLQIRGWRYLQNLTLFLTSMILMPTLMSAPQSFSFLTISM